MDKQVSQKRIRVKRSANECPHEAIKLYLSQVMSFGEEDWAYSYKKKGDHLDVLYFEDISESRQWLLLGVRRKIWIKNMVLFLMLLTMIIINSVLIDQTSMHRDQNLSFRNRQRNMMHKNQLQMKSEMKILRQNRLMAMRFTQILKQNWVIYDLSLSAGNPVTYSLVVQSQSALDAEDLGKQFKQASISKVVQSRGIDKLWRISNVE